MTSIILNAVRFNKDIPIVVRIGVTNKGFANSIAPRLLEEKNCTREMYNKRLRYLTLHADYKTLEFAKFLSRTYIYAKELNLHYLDEPMIFLDHIKEDISDMRPSTLISIPFKYYTDFNIGCLNKLYIVDETPSGSSYVDGTTKKQIIIKNLEIFEACLVFHTIQDFLLYGYFGHIGFYISQKNYLHNINKILSNVSFCKTFELVVEFCEEVEDLPRGMNFECVFESLRIMDDLDNDCINSMIFNEKLESLEITTEDGGILCPDISYSNTELFLQTKKEKINLHISKLYENKHIRISVQKNKTVLKISNAKGKTFEITTDGEVEFDEEPEKCIIKRC